MKNQGPGKLVLLLLLMVPVLPRAQIELEVLTNPEDVRIHRIGPEEGLTTKNIFDLHIDSYGFLWFTSDYGLGYYDGYRVRSFISREGDSTSLSDDFVYTIYEDGNGDLWVSTRRGLSRFDRGRECFRTYYPDPQDLNSPANNIYFVKEDSKGVFWVFTDAGIITFNREREAFARFEQDIYLYNPKPELLPHWADVMFAEDSSGHVWLSGILPSDGIYKYDRGKEKFRLYRYAEGHEYPQSVIGTFSVTVDRLGSVWVSSYGAGIFRLVDEESGRFKQYIHRSNDPSSIHSNRLEHVFLDPSGNLWISGVSGFSRYNEESDDFTAYYVPLAQEMKQAAHPAPENILLRFSADTRGRLWCTSWEGIYCFDPAEGKIKHLMHDPVYPYKVFYGDRAFPTIVATPAHRNDIVDLIVDDKGLIWVSVLSEGIYKIDEYDKPFRHHHPQQNISSIYEDKNGLLWLGTAKEGLLLLDPLRNDKSFLYRAGPARSSDGAVISSNAIQLIYQDRKENLWIGTGHGLNRVGFFSPMDLDHKPVLSFDKYINDTLMYRFRGHEIFDIQHDREGRLWVATDQGINLLVEGKDRFTQVLRDPEDLLQNEYSFDCSIVELFEDREGYMWIGTTNCGLFRYNLNDSSLAGYQNIPGDTSTISDNNIRQITQDPWGRLWIGTSKGLNRFNAQTAGFRFFGPEEGFQGEMIQGMVCDDRGNLWISHNQGISKLFLSGNEAFLDPPHFLSL